VIQPFAELGSNVFNRGGGLVGHNTVIKDHWFVAGGVTVLGHVTVEPFCLLGAGSTIKNGVTIGRQCAIGAGALILEDTKPQQVYIGRHAQLMLVPSDQLLHGSVGDSEGRPDHG